MCNQKHYKSLTTCAVVAYYYIQLVVFFEEEFLHVSLYRCYKLTDTLHLHVLHDRC